MSDAPKTIWAQDAVPDECSYTGGGWWDDSIGNTQYPHMAEYTLTASVAARLKAADELEEAITNEREMVCQDMDMQAQVSKRLEEAITAYRATKEIPE